MDISLKHITVRELTKNYVDNDEQGVLGFNKTLNIRPAYQREFVYEGKQRSDVIETVRKGFPLNVMYWVKNKDNSYEVLDGQQRSISICQYINGDYSLNKRYFHNLENVEQEQILNYKLMVYFCEGNSKEKLDWFETINIAGEKLSKQELRNALHVGPWLSDAKKHFSKQGCAAYGIANNLLKGSSKRQDYLETAIKWINNGDIEDYMAKHQHDITATNLWNYFQSVVKWTNMLFVEYRKEMKGVDFGLLYNNFKDKSFDPTELEGRIKSLMMDEDVTKKSGIYEYVINGNEKALNIRDFNDKQRREAYERQNGTCLKCGKKFKLEEMHADHHKAWSKGGPTTAANLKMMCADDNWDKSNK